MATPQRTGFRALPTSRLEAFSDGVFAIAVTIIVLELGDPRHQTGHLAAALLAQWPAYVAYVASFAYVGVIWLNHHQAFARIAVADRRLLALNLVLLFTVSVVAFPTGVLADAMRERLNGTDAQTAVVLYALIAALMCLSWVALYGYLRRHPELLVDGVEANYVRHGLQRSAAGIGLYALGAVVGYFWLPVVALVIFALVPAFYFLTTEGFTGPDAPDA